MAHTVTALAIFALAIASVQQIEAAGDLQNLVKYGIVPEYIDEVPSESIDIIYPSGAEVLEGQQLDPVLTLVAPSTISYKASSDQLYTLIMLDFDAASPGLALLSPLLHLQIVNIPGARVNDGQVTAAYINPIPVIGTHRFVFFLYTQQTQIDAEPVEVLQRTNYDYREFVSANNLELIGANFFRSSVVSDTLPDLLNLKDGSVPGLVNEAQNLL